MVPEQIINEDGYTLLEVLIGLTLVSIAVIIISVSFTFLSGWISNWSERASLERTYQVLHMDIRQTILSSDEIVIDDSSYFFFRKDSLIKEYSLKKGNLYIDNTLFSYSGDSIRVSMSEVNSSSNIYNYYVAIYSEGRSAIDSGFVESRNKTFWDSYDRED